MIYLYCVSYCVAVVVPWFFPKPNQRECEVDALVRGHHPFLIRFTRSTQFFTLYGQLWLILALLTENPTIRSIALIIETMVMILYFTFIRIDPTLLAYDGPVLVNQVTGFLPPMNRYCVVWFGLLVQHLICPLHLWVSGEIMFGHWDVIYAVCAVFAYICWSDFCWYVQGKPTYPIQQRVFDSGLEEYASVGMVVMCFSIGTICECYLF